MRGLWYLSWRHALDHRAQTLVMTLCIAISIFLPLCAQLWIGGYRRELMSRAAETPLVMGAKGNRFDLTLASLYFRHGDLDTIPYSQLSELQDAAMGTAVPLHLRYSAQGYPVVGTAPEYFELRRLRAGAGTLPLQLGDALVGMRVASELDLHPGDTIFSDQKELYDISKPPALKMHVCGVLAESGTADDGAVFVDIKTAWVLEGIAHGHQDVARDVDESLVLGRGGENVAVSQALIEYNEITPENIATFHYHGDPANFPLSAILFYPRDEKAGTILRARINATHLYQMLVPTTVIEDLLAFVFRIKSFFDGISILLATSTAAMSFLVLLLSVRVRAPEIKTLNRIGCSRFAVAKLIAIEIAIIMGMSLLLAATASALAVLFLPDLLTLF